jgi:PPM family protein phosphatase
MAARHCSFCDAAVSAQARFCHACGRPLPDAIDVGSPVESAMPGSRNFRLHGDQLNLRELINVVESGVRWWESGLASADLVTRQRAAQAIEELSQVLHSLAQQVAQGQETVRITTRLPTLRSGAVECPTCKRANRAGAKFCLGCGTVLKGPARQPIAKVVPMSLRFVIAARTDQGRVRAINQDTVFAGALALENGGTAYLCIVADGMGGAKAGEYASRVAADVTRISVQHEAGSEKHPDDQSWQKVLHTAATAANRRVYEESRSDRDRQGMGTTLTIAVLVGDRLHIASVGDSRLYLFNASGVTEDGANSAQLTSDHSLVARLVDIGQLTQDQARAHPQRNMLYRSIGTDPAVEVDTRSEQVEPGDVVLLCSDGLVNHVTDEEIAQAVLPARDPDAACEELVALANQRGGRDNITVVVVRVEKGG